VGLGRQLLGRGFLGKRFSVPDCMTSTPPDGVISPDFEIQGKQCLENTLMVLNQTDMNFANVVEMTRFYVDIECHFDNFKSIRSHCAMKPYPARTAVEVSCLVNPLALIEVRFIAAATS
jgi:enamine deaminase RidA (YjgF/YER057c/UK114 family)